MTAAPGVPVFNCIVNVSRTADGSVLATVANLAGLSATGRSEREALTQIVAAFKQTISQIHSSGESIRWIDPPVPPAAEGTQRLIAVHL
jgi:predicted RNase H-like HicB family nuclease